MIAPTGVDLKVGSWRTDQRLAPSVLIASRRPTHRSKATGRPVTMAWVARRSDAFSLALHPVAPPGPSTGSSTRRADTSLQTKHPLSITKAQNSAQLWRGAPLWPFHLVPPPSRSTRSLHRQQEKVSVSESADDDSSFDHKEPEKRSAPAQRAP